uniref:Uncharacterized protein n=1 Tax=Tanacetum cinerariifolium TaxID=118510 RepID=A0A6L2J9P2_TANCI|nr:hypothetical protein [Tanacetum cinerariifolium]
MTIDSGALSEDDDEGDGGNGSGGDADGGDTLSKDMSRDVSVRSSSDESSYVGLKFESESRVQPDKVSTRFGDDGMDTTVVTSEEEGELKSMKNIKENIMNGIGSSMWDGNSNNIRSHHFITSALDESLNSSEIKEIWKNKSRVAVDVKKEQSNSNAHEIKDTKEEVSPRCLNEEMVADLRYFNSLESEVDSLRFQLETQKTQFLNETDRLSREYYYADHMNAILGVYTELDEVTNLQCDYLELLEKCEGLETELSKSQMMSKSFESVQKHAINLQLELQQCKESIKNAMFFKVNKSKDFFKEREQYFEIQDLKAQLQDKGIVISELKKLIEKIKGKYVDTKFEKSSVIRQPNAFKSQRPSVLGKPTTFSNSFALEGKSAMEILIVMDNSNSPNESNEDISKENPVIPKPNHVEDTHDPNEMVDIPNDEDLVDYDRDDEEPKEEPGQQIRHGNRFAQHPNPQPATPPRATVTVSSTYEVGGPSITAIEGPCFPLPAPRLHVPPTVTEDLSTRLGNLEYRHGVLMRKMEEVSDAEVADSISIEEIHARVATVGEQVQVIESQAVQVVSGLKEIETRVQQVESKVDTYSSGQMAVPGQDEIVGLSQQVQTLQMTLHGTELQNQQLWTRVAEMESHMGILMSYMLWMEERRTILENRLPG